LKAIDIDAICRSAIYLSFDLNDAALSWRKGNYQLLPGIYPHGYSV